MRFEVVILGSNSALPAHGRNPSAQVVKMERELFLVDCGEGTQVRLSECKVKRGRINQIFISHLHGDHFFGLIGLLTTFELLGRTDDMHIHAPSGLKEIIDVHLKHSHGPLSYPLIYHFTQTECTSLIYESEFVQVFSIPLVHRIPTTGFLFKEKPRPPKLRKEKIEELSLSIEEIKAIKQGKGVIREHVNIPAKELTMEASQTRSYAYCSDTAYNEALVPIIQGCDLLYHESTFDKESVDKAAVTMHSTTHQAAKIAVAANVKQLIIGHFSTKYADLMPLLLEAQEVFTATELATEGRTFSIPISHRVS